MRLPPDVAARCRELAGVTDPAPKGRKYHNEPVTVDGVWYDSKKEARHGALLAAMARDGLIRDLRRQVRYALVVNGVKVCVYQADFVYFDCAKDAVSVVDVKGYKTREYEIKKRLMLAVYGIAVVEV